MITGEEFENQLKSRKSDISKKIKDIDAKISTTEHEIARQNAIRSEALTRLADLYISDNGVFTSEFKKINSRLQSLFNDRSTRREQINIIIGELENKAADLDKSRVKSAELVSEIKDEIIEARGKVAMDLKQSENFNKLDSEIQVLEHLVAKDINRLARLNEDCHLKRSVFLKDIYFAYLLDLKFGTPDYHAGWFPKMDRWLARISRFDENFQKYEILGLIPGRVVRANEERKKIIEEKKAEREKIIAELEQKHGVAELRDKLNAAEKTWTDLLESFSSIATRQRLIIAEKKLLDTNKDPYIAKAKEELKNFFDTHDIAELKAKALATHSNEDDYLIRQLESSEYIINHERKKAKELIKERAPLEEQLIKARNAEYAISRNNYNSRYSRFDTNAGAGNLLDGFILGSMTQSAFESTLRRSHSEDRPSYSSNYSSNRDSSSFSSSSSDSYSSGGGFDSGGSSSGGDF